MVTQGVPDRDQELAAMRVLVDEVLELAATGGADAAEVSASMHSGLSATVRLGEVETLEHHRDRGVAVTVFIGRSRGHATSADLQADSIRRCVSRALDIARFTQEDRCNGLADPGRLATHFPDLDLWHPRAMNPEEAIQRALACEAAGLEDARVTNSEGASVSAHVGAAVYGNSHGFRGESSGTRYDQSCVLVAGQGGGMQRDYWYDSRRAFEDLEAVELTGRKAAERAVRRLESRKIATCEVPVLFAPEVARSLVGHFVGAVSGRALYQNASFLKDTLGERLFPGWLSIRELPFLPRGPGSTAFDAEGVATRERDLIDHGVLTGYVLVFGGGGELPASEPAGGLKVDLLERPVYYDFDLFEKDLDRDLLAMPLADLHLVVFDTETTGLEPSRGDEIVQIAGVRVLNGRVLEEDRFDELVNPGMPIPRASTRIHGISDDMVAGREPARDVLPRFHAFVGDAVLVAHNAAFDMKFLKLKEHEIGARFDSAVLDTLLLSVVLQPSHATHTLDAIASRFGIENHDRHSALGDSVTTAEVFVKMIDVLEARGIRNLGQALEASDRVQEIKRLQERF